MTGATESAVRGTSEYKPMSAVGGDVVEYIALDAHKEYSFASVETIVVGHHPHVPVLMLTAKGETAQKAA